MEFKNWLVINEGVSVGVSIPPEKMKRESNDLLELASELAYALSQKGHKLEFEQIAPDGDDYYKQKGLLNFYVGGMKGTGSSRNVESMIIDAIKYLNKKGIKTGRPIKNSWQDTYEKDIERGYDPEKLKADYSERARGNLKALRVMRLPVEMNPEVIKAADMPPNVDMGFETAKIVFEDIFGLPSAGGSPLNYVMGKMTGEEPESVDWNGYNFTADQIINTYNKIKDDLPMWAGLGTTKGFERKPDDEYKGPHIFSSGINKDRILRAVQSVYELAKWAKQRGYNQMYGA